MRNILYGYRIVDGKAQIVEEEAEKIRITARRYLAGASFSDAAREAGIMRTHGAIRHMMENESYLGTDFYPPILDEQTFYAIRIERNRRIGWLDRDTRTRKIPAAVPIHTKFNLPKQIEMTITNPYRHAEYIYGLIESEVE